MPTSLLTSKGQITLPKAVREALRLHAGDQVDFVLAPDGHIELRRVGGRVRELLGAFPSAGAEPVRDARILEAEFHESLAVDDERIGNQP
jgi:AbrB family looped-hinge helix DNA binding protein